MKRTIVIILFLMAISTTIAVTPVARWPLKEMGGITIHDAIGTNDGTWVGTELITDGSMTNSANWTDPGTWTVAGNIATRTANATNPTLTPAVALTLTVGKRYTISFALTSTAGTLTVTSLDGSQTLATYVNGVDNNGTKTITATLTGDDLINFTANATFAGTVDDVSIREVIPFNGTGIEFDGAGDKITVPADPSIDAKDKTTLTISAWIKPSQSGRIVDKHDSTGKGYKFYVSGGGITLITIIEHDTTAAQAIKTNIVTVGAWGHVVFVYNEDGAKKIKLYLDGALQTLSSDTAGVGTISDDSSEDLRIGTDENDGNNFGGSISDVRIYDTALTANQVKDIFTDKQGNRRSRYNHIDYRSGSRSRYDYRY